MTLNELLTGIADAIRFKKGSEDKIKAESFADEIIALPSGGGSVASVAEKDVNFYDYDGTCVYAYTLEEAQALTELPFLPAHEGLTPQEWNYTLDEIKSYNRRVDVGATYITDDGKTRLYISIPAEGRMTVPLHFTQTVANGVTIDWGDGSAIETLSGIGKKATTHTYASIGDYVITLAVANGCTMMLGNEANNLCVIGNIYNNTEMAYNSMLKKVEIGSGVTAISTYTFSFCRGLSSIVIPKEVTAIYQHAFRECVALSFIVIPRGVTNIYSVAFANCYNLSGVVLPNGMININSDSAFGSCYNLSRLVLPNNVSFIGEFAFSTVYGLASIAIPSSVTIISAFAFQNCFCVKFYDFTSHTSVPTLSNTNAFQNMPSDCEIRVPAALYDQWKAATNWSSLASNIVAV